MVLVVLLAAGFLLVAELALRDSAAEKQAWTRQAGWLQRQESQVEAGLLVALIRMK